MLDDGPFGALSQAVGATAHWTAGVLHVSEAVAAAAQSDRSGRRQRLLAEGGETSRIVAEHSVAPATEAWRMLFTHLRVRYADAVADFAEHEAIALCACQLRDFTFVTADKTAAMLALAELGPGRVASPFDLWEDLRTRGFIDTAERDALHARTLKSDAKMPGLPWRLKA